MKITFKVLFIVILFFNNSIIFAQAKSGLKFHTESCVSKPGQKYNSCQLFNPHQNPQTGKPILVDNENKYALPLAARVGTNRLQSSNTRLQVDTNHPSGAQMFPDNGTLSALLNTFLQNIEKDEENYFLVYFAKIHLLVLHELYQYLMSIYVTFNMTHVQTVEEHLLNQTTQALNKKTMIINHLFSIIEAQSNQAILTRFPNLHPQMATKMGKMMMKHDYGSDLNLMLENQEEVLFAPYFNDCNNFDDETQRQDTKKKFMDRYKKRRELYLSIFGDYLKFFQSYTATLYKENPIYGSDFVKYAGQIQKVLDGLDSYHTNLQKKLQGADIKAKAKALKEIKIINPPLFFYNPITFRGMKLIPRLAKDLPKNSQNVPWPKKLIDDATSGEYIKNKFGNVISNLPPAYFEDARGNTVKDPAQAVSLFVNIPTIQHMFTQEVIPQPDWLNSYDGVMMMLRACLGDFTALFSPQLKDELIIDPCLSCIILNAAQKAGIAIAGTNIEDACSACQTYLTSLQKIIGWVPPTKDLDCGTGTNGTGNGDDTQNGNGTGGMPGTGGLG